MPQSRDEFLQHVADVYYDWSGKHADSVPFDPGSRPDSDDYNLWVADMDGDGDVQDEFFNTVGPVDYERDSTDEVESDTDI